MYKKGWGTATPARNQMNLVSVGAEKYGANNGVLGMSRDCVLVEKR